MTITIVVMIIAITVAINHLCMLHTKKSKTKGKRKTELNGLMNE
jgi:hypothetical protein